MNMLFFWVRFSYRAAVVHGLSVRLLFDAIAELPDVSTAHGVVGARGMVSTGKYRRQNVHGCLGVTA